MVTVLSLMLTQLSYAGNSELKKPDSSKPASNMIFYWTNQGMVWYSGEVYTSVDGLTWSPYSSKARINKLICSGDSLWAVEACGDNNNSSKLYRSANGRDWSYITDIPNKSIDEIIYTGRKYILIGNKSSANSVSESHAYSMVSKGGDLWEYSWADKNMEFTNVILHSDKRILAATGKGIFILSEK